MIYTYLPQQIIKKPVREMDFEEFFSYYAKAEYARSLRIEEIEIGIVKGISDIFGGE